MNTKELQIEMLRHNETGEHLSKYLGITRQTLSRKMSSENSSDFTQSEIKKIKEHYNLSVERISEIFFDENLS